RARRTVSLRAFPRSALRRRGATRIGAAASAGRRAALRVLQARGRTNRARLRGTTTGAARSVNVALLVGSGDGVLQGVLLSLVRNVRRAVRVVVVQSRDR